MKILLLGGTGAMGVSLVDILAKNRNDIYITSRIERFSENEYVNYLKGDAKNDDFLNKILAWQFDVIVDFMSYTLEEFRNRKEKLLNSTNHYLFLSSSRVYANSNTPITESSPRLLDVCKDKVYLKTNEYALVKARQEDLLMNSQKKNWTILRPYITFNYNRFQLGIFEKEDWLYRALNNKTICFFKDIAEKTTTLTYGYDVAYVISKLIGNKKALGESVHIASNEALTWNEIVEIYFSKLRKVSKIEPKIVLLENSIDFGQFSGKKYQICYDRLYNRRFDSSKVEFICGERINYTPFEVAIEKSLVKLLDESIDFTTSTLRTEAYFDKITKERKPLSHIKPIKQKVKYLIMRYTNAYK